MISLASSFQRRQTHPVSISLAPTNPCWTLAFTKFQPWTSSAYGHHHGVYLVELNTVVLWITRFRCRLRHLPQRRWLLSNSDEPFRRHRSSLVEGEHTIAFVSLFPFCFSVQSTVSWSSSSNPCYPLCLCTAALCPRRPSQAPLAISQSGGRGTRLRKSPSPGAAWRRSASQALFPHRLTPSEHPATGARAAGRRPSPPAEIQPPPPVPTAGEHTSEIPLLSSTHFAPQPSPCPPPLPATQNGQEVRRGRKAFAVLRLGPCIPFKP
jgi:hypothetical protein